MVISLKPYQGKIAIDTVLDVVELTDGAASSARVTGEVTLSEGTKVSVKGEIEYDYSFLCDRCGSKSTMKVKSAFDEVFDINPGDEEFYQYEGDRLDMSTMLRDCVIFSIPQRRVCADSCKGLCGVCGTDLNINRCDCDDSQSESIVSPFEVLKEFGGDK